MSDERPRCALGPLTPGGASGGCTSGQRAAYRIRFSFMRADLSGVQSKEFNVCGECYADKVREAEAEGGTITILASYT